MRTLVTWALPPLGAGLLFSLCPPGGAVPRETASAAGAQDKRASAIANSAPAGALTRSVAPLLAETTKPFRSMAVEREDVCSVTGPPPAPGVEPKLPALRLQTSG